MARIRYIGPKDLKVDNVCLSATTWHGYGDVQEVPDNLAARFLKHVDVWEAAGPADVPQSEEEAAEADANLATLRAQAVELGIEVVPQWRERRLQTEINKLIAARQNAGA